MPQGGFGNLVALPLQKGPRGQGNSVFLDDDLAPWADQWAFLARVRKIYRAQIEGIVQEAERGGRILGVRLPPQKDGEEEPWTAAPSRRRKAPPIVDKLPRTLEVVLGNQIYIPKEGLHPGLRNRLLRLAAFQNPEFYKAQAMRLSTYNKPRVVACAEDHPLHIGLPRGCLDDLRQTLTDVDIAPERTPDPGVRVGWEAGSPMTRFSLVYQCSPFLANSFLCRQLLLTRLFHISYPFAAVYRACQPNVTRNVTHDGTLAYRSHGFQLDGPRSAPCCSHAHTGRVRLFRRVGCRRSAYGPVLRRGLSVRRSVVPGVRRPRVGETRQESLDPRTDPRGDNRPSST